MPEGGTLSIKVGPHVVHEDRLTHEIKNLLIVVQDQGPGIPKELREKVFEPFFTTKTNGTGLGLAICNSIIKRYNGNIWIDKVDDSGTVVKIVLPVGHMPENKDEANEQTQDFDH